MSNEALYAFGHGLTYSRFEYDDVRLSTESLDWNAVLTVTAKITNTGEREAEEVVQLYVRDRAASMTRPIRELKGFQKLRLPPGTSEEVKFTLTRRDLAFYNAQMKFEAEPGEFDVWVAPSATTGVGKRFELNSP